MARTQLFTALRRILHTQVAMSGASSSASLVASRRLSRRAFGAGALSAGALVGLPVASVVTAGCADMPQAASPEPPPEAPARVIVVGAGIAGLHAAYRLHQAGVDVKVYDASDRAGGRMFTARGKFADDQVCELGGELIDTNHRYMFALAEEFGLTLDDRTAGTDAGYVVDSWFVGGRVVSEQTVVEQFTAVATQILSDMEAADADEDRYAELDNTTLKDYLDQVSPPDQFAELHAILTAAYLGEFGLETSEQSALNLIYLIDAGTADPFRIFGDSDERYHVHGGNDLVPQALAKKLGARVVLERKLVAAKRTKAGYTLTFEKPIGARQEETCDRVVFALPFTTLRRVDLTQLELSDEKLAIIESLGYGTNTKVMGGFTSRVWRDAFNSSGAVTSDSALQQTWDSSIGQAGNSGILTNFLGGAQGLAAGVGEPDAWFQAQLVHLESIFPGVSAAYVPGSAVRMFWPTAPNALGSYTCYRPGQWSFWGTEGLPEGAVHFCGEHTSAEFQGWMEGGAETGARVAVEILNALNIDLPKHFATIVDPETALPGQELHFDSTRLSHRMLRAR